MFLLLVACDTNQSAPVTDDPHPTPQEEVVATEDRTWRDQYVRVITEITPDNVGDIVRQTYMHMGLANEHTPIEPAVDFAAFVRAVGILGDCYCVEEVDTTFEPHRPTPDATVWYPVTKSGCRAALFHEGTWWWVELKPNRRQSSTLDIEPYRCEELPPPF